MKEISIEEALKHQMEEASADNGIEENGVYVITDENRIMVQWNSEDARSGFFLGYEDQSWDGGNGAANEWEKIDYKDPRITISDHINMDSMVDYNMSDEEKEDFVRKMVDRLPNSFAVDGNDEICAFIKDPSSNYGFDLHYEDEFHEGCINGNGYCRSFEHISFNDPRITPEMHAAFDDKQTLPLNQEDVQRGNIEKVRDMLDKGADVNVCKSRDDKSVPLYWALANGHEELATLLVQHGADVNAKYGGGPLLCDAARDGNTDSVKFLLDNGADVGIKAKSDGSTPLHLASYGCHLGIAKMLVDKGADINAKSNGGWTPLHEAAKGIEEKRESTVRYLIQSGADVNAKSEWGQTPLHEAARFGYTDAVKVLIEKGADVNAIDNFGATPCHGAVKEFHEDTIVVLMQHGAKTDIKDDNGITVESNARRHGCDNLNDLLPQPDKHGKGRRL